jgi:hypothetical protein
MENDLQWFDIFIDLFMLAILGLLLTAADTGQS